MSNLSISDNVYSLLKKSLDASSIRGKIIANNIANINTKGYKRYTVSFEENLKESLQSFAMKTTDKRHINDEDTFGEIKITQDTASSMREDGNNVDIDNEMANQAANNLIYNALISQVNSRIAMERYIIKEGRG
ncbi:flagellar basal body rod protein FlgB [Clostridium sp. SYSU_GA19001]|uniref:flagellar basal body rod protein FlgB n=1 Tax=Clostridium caldaquaticum TaxID=2940653 RepID=UPI002076FCFE|nr:flagellar basal body rod protein FlgB [Clostridium caldaquaticum]MCM8710966.1 flagellar basal body rod protein FlgB [Clostridium caldaquaticum]